MGRYAVLGALYALGTAEEHSRADLSCPSTHVALAGWRCVSTLCSCTFLPSLTKLKDISKG